MNAIVEALTGMNKLTDQVIATDFLASVKSIVITYSIAITETTSPQVRCVLRKQLEDAIKTHEAISDYMMKRGYYHAFDLREQYKVDMQVAKTALTLASKNH